MLQIRNDEEYGYLYDTGMDSEDFSAFDLSNANATHISIVDGNDMAQLQNESFASMMLIAILSKKNNTIGLLRNRASRCGASSVLFAAMASPEYRSFQ